MPKRRRPDEEIPGAEAAECQAGNDTEPDVYSVPPELKKLIVIEQDGTQSIHLPKNHENTAWYDDFLIYTDPQGSTPDHRLRIPIKSWRFDYCITEREFCLHQFDLESGNEYDDFWCNARSCVRGAITRDYNLREAAHN